RENVGYSLTTNIYNYRVRPVGGPRCSDEIRVNGYARQWKGWESQPQIKTVAHDPPQLESHPTHELGAGSSEERAPGPAEIVAPPMSGEVIVPMPKNETVPASGLLSLYYPTASSDEPVENATRISFGGLAHIQTKDPVTGSIRRMQVPVVTLPGEVPYACRRCFQLRSAWRLEETCTSWSIGVSDLCLDAFYEIDNWTD
ncbi:unnamed protein product, partial [Rhizoctonia solani]